MKTDKEERKLWLECQSSCGYLGKRPTEEDIARLILDAEKLNIIEDGLVGVSHDILELAESYPLGSISSNALATLAIKLTLLAKQ